MRKFVFVLLVILSFALAINLSSAALQCEIKASCSGGEKEVLWATDTSEAHFGYIGSSDITYNARLCCWGISPLKTTSGDIFHISSTENAHIGASYTTPVMLSSKSSVTIDCDSITTTDDCAFSLSALYEDSGPGNGGAHADAQCDKPGYFNLYCGARCDPDLDADCCNDVMGATPSINSDYPTLYDPAPPWDFCDTTGGGNCFNLDGEISSTTCCGDDTGEYKLVSAGAGSDGTDACCNSANKCVWNDACYSSAACGGDGNRYYCNAGTWQFVDSDGDGFDNNCDVDQDNPCSVFKVADNCNNLISQGCGGCVNGTVKNATGMRLQDAIVRAVGFPKYKATTDANGNYWIFNITPETYDFSAEKSGYVPALRASESVSDIQVTTINFVLGHGSSLCQADCSYTSDNSCHVDCEGSCDGVSCCTFYDSNAKSICDNRLVNFRMDYNTSHEIQCCRGNPYITVKAIAATEINATNIVRTTRTVWYEGKLIKLIVDVFG